MQSSVLWYWLCDLSERAILNALRRDNKEVTIPLESSLDPVAEFRATEVGKNPFRLAVFTLWLKHQPGAFQWFEKILQENEALVREAAAQLVLLNGRP